MTQVRFLPPVWILATLPVLHLGCPGAKGGETGLLDTSSSGSESDEEECDTSDRYVYCDTAGNVAATACGEVWPGEECVNAACVETEGGGASCCAAESAKTCVGNDVYWEDSCGGIGAFIETCGDACYDGECVQSVCTPYVSLDEESCSRASVYAINLNTVFNIVRGAAPTPLYFLDLGDSMTYTCESETLDDRSYRSDCYHPEISFTCRGEDIYYVYACE